MRISDWSSDVCSSDLMGPGGRNFANAVAVVRCDLSPPALLDRLKKIERSFGRRLARRWGARVLDIDIVLWSAGAWPARLRWRAARGLAVPPRSMAERGRYEGRRVRDECVSTCRSRWAPEH